MLNRRVHHRVLRPGVPSSAREGGIERETKSYFLIERPLGHRFERFITLEAFYCA